MRKIPGSATEPVRFEDTMRRRIEQLGREGRVKTLALYTGAYYPADIRAAAVRAIGAVPSWDAGIALLRLLLSADDALLAEVNTAVFRWCDVMDIGPLTAAVLFSRVGGENAPPRAERGLHPAE